MSVYKVWAYPAEILYAEFVSKRSSRKPWIELALINRYGLCQIRVKNSDRKNDYADHSYKTLGAGIRAFFHMVGEYVIEGWQLNDKRDYREHVKRE